MGWISIRICWLRSCRSRWLASSARLICRSSCCSVRWPRRSQRIVSRSVRIPSPRSFFSAILSLRLVVPMRGPSWRRSKDDPGLRGASRQPRRVLVRAELRDDEKGRRRVSWATPLRSRAALWGEQSGHTAPGPKRGSLPRQAAANQVEVFLASRLAAHPSRASPAPMGAPASCATAPRTTGTHPRALAKTPTEAPVAVAPCLREPGVAEFAHTR